MTAESTLFVVLPSGHGELPLAAMRPRPQLVAYGPADDERHMLSLVRARRDRRATRWLRGLFACVAAGAVLGLLVNGILAGGFCMFGGLLEIALPLGFVLGAFLGGFTAAMTGTEVARDEVRRLVAACPRGSTLVQLSAASRTDLQAVRDHCDTAGLLWAWRD